MSEARYRSNTGLIATLILVLYIAAAVTGDPSIAP